MGYAARLGKTYTMLEEAQELKAAGHDVVIGYFQPQVRQQTIAKPEWLELIHRKKVDCLGLMFQGMHRDALLPRRPEVCLVDEFPRTNVPGSDRAKRWEDVEALLSAGINVLSPMNIQHLESLNDQ